MLEKLVLDAPLASLAWPGCSGTWTPRALFPRHTNTNRPRN